MPSSGIETHLWQPGRRQLIKASKQSPRPAALTTKGLASILKAIGLLDGGYSPSAQVRGSSAGASIENALRRYRSPRALRLSESSVFARIPHELDQPEHLTCQRMKQSGRTPSAQWTRKVALSVDANYEAVGLMLTSREGRPAPGPIVLGADLMCPATGRLLASRQQQLHDGFDSFRRVRPHLRFRRVYTHYITFVRCSFEQAKFWSRFLNGQPYRES